MIFLSNSLTSPGIGTIFWSAFIFLIFFFVLTKFAWKPVLSMLKKREETIKDSLDAAEHAREEMSKLKSDNETILAQARAEREKILVEAREVKDKMISEAKEQASSEAEKLVAKAKADIEREKAKAMSEIQSQVTSLSVEIASKILGEKLSTSAEQEKLIQKYLNDINVN